MKPELLRALLDRASKEEIGLMVETNNPKGLQQNLMDFSADIERFPVSISIPSIPNWVAISRNTVTLDQDPSEFGLD